MKVFESVLANLSTMDKKLAFVAQKKHDDASKCWNAIEKMFAKKKVFNIIPPIATSNIYRLVKKETSM